MIQQAQSFSAAGGRREHPAPPPRRSRAFDGNTDTPRILLVEDNFIMAIDIEAGLTEAGFDVMGVSTTADEAVSMAATLRPTLVIMDVHLAGQRDGVDAALEIYRSLGVRSVFATAHYDSAVRSRAAPSRPLAWVPKPYSTDLLVSIIRGAIKELEN